ncbi:MAG: hypothetical protein A2826_02460 [Candidatus Doudnabacteria bacterium RIFCSPHIGHO2_01_FULL_43_23]|uniref:Uncharacterized protein n=1 Tax=Candidatus Doudnabacteria bacterium RIFCSPHIGHO2_01_FULL_43_23 TaxID=1817822 RepID=A0A1F5NTR2_9BACT|nr:MAG: hypothetical protein A2826_02460 [Candidatus Doudnabacteria bacterium RIFCSPHIGHO2_01_FULL_43_23]
MKLLFTATLLTAVLTVGVFYGLVYLRVGKDPALSLTTGFIGILGLLLLIWNMGSCLRFYPMENETAITNANFFTAFAMATSSSCIISNPKLSVVAAITLILCAPIVYDEIYPKVGRWKIYALWLAEGLTVFSALTLGWGCVILGIALQTLLYLQFRNQPDRCLDLGLVST